jgi:AAA15 family ATPase/GTPase
VHVQRFVKATVGEEAVSEDRLRHYTVHTLHQIPGAAEPVEFSLERDESNGTQRFFALVGPVLDALDDGDLVVVDELECSMHPLLTGKLVELFQSPDANCQGAQLVFATHDSSLMTPSLFRRDQIWLTEKNRKGATELFSLCEMESPKRPRKGEAFEKNYLSGRYGGIPNFGPAFEDLEVR